jgi:thiamine-phosphate pyrophosphorylase
MQADYRLYLITDRNQTRGRALPFIVEEALQGGVRAVQLREKDLPAHEYHSLAVEFRKLTSQYGAKLLINGRAEIVRDIGADGLHLPENGLSATRAREIIGPERLIGISCHSLDSAIAAQKCGADFITFGPVFFTRSKAEYGSPVGLERLAEAAAALTIPVYGLGGIREDNIHQVMAAGAHGVAFISAILSADNPRRAAENIAKILHTNTDSVRAIRGL